MKPLKRSHWATSLRDAVAKRIERGRVALTDQLAAGRFGTLANLADLAPFSKGRFAVFASRRPTPHDADLDPALVDTCRRIMRHHAKSFSRAARFLPRRFADPVAVLYAFCRLADDAVDLAPDPVSAKLAADAFMAELDHPDSARPVIRAFDAWSTKHPLARRAARELLTGIASDVAAVRVADEAELVRYAYRVAGTVGILMCAVLEVEDPAALPFAVDLGIAMQLTNIARDVAEDATHNRVYLPSTLLARFGTTSDALIAAAPRPAGTAPRTLIAPTSAASIKSLAPAVLALLDLADRYYESAERGMHYLPATARPAILVASRLYRAIGDTLRRRGGNPLLGRAFVTPAERPALIVQALRTATAIAIGSAARGPHDATLHAAIAGFPGSHAA